jgi:bacterioferritin-associated ferredoxin
VIVCSCNVLSAAQILATLQREDAAHPCSPARAYRCLGCAPRCGRCIPTIRALLVQAHAANVNVGCHDCPGKEAEREAPQPVIRTLLLAAE